MICFLLLSLFFNFEQLQEIKAYPVEIEIRGFLYSREGEWILAKEPNLKSCCVSKRPHIIAKGLKGHFSPSKAYLLKGRLSSIYVLEETEIVKEESKTASLALFAGIGIATLMLFKRYVF